MPAWVRAFDDGRVEGDLETVARRIAEARCPAALTGAGISVDSGIPDFRSPGGLWSTFDPMEYATLSCFRNDPDKAWLLYRALAGSIKGKKPSPAHLALARLEQIGRLDGIVTQNVDGLHQAAGSRTVLEIHGGSDELHCLACETTEPFDESLLEPGPAPRCGVCGHALKPTVVLYEEPVREVAAIERLIARTDLLLTVGTSGQVTPACLYPGRVRAGGGSVIEFNVERELPDATLGPRGAFVEGRASLSLPQIVERVVRLREAREPS